MNHASQHAEQGPREAGLDATERCPLCGEVLRRLAPGGRTRDQPDLHAFYRGRVCGWCAGRFNDCRLMAFLVDMIVLGCGWATLEIVSDALPGAAGSDFEVDMALFFTPLALLAIPCWPLQLGNMVAALSVTGMLLLAATLLSVLLKDGYQGRSPGKALLGLRVVHRDTLSPANFADSLKRNLVLLLPFYIGHIAIGLTLKRVGRFGEKWAGTMVIEERHRHHPIFAKPSSRCRHCGYDLTGNISGRCPECGTRVSPNGGAAWTLRGASIRPTREATRRGPDPQDRIDLRCDGQDEAGPHEQDEQDA